VQQNLKFTENPLLGGAMTIPNEADITFRLQIQSFVQWSNLNALTAQTFE